MGNIIKDIYMRLILFWHYLTVLFFDIKTTVILTNDLIAVSHVQGIYNKRNHEVGGNILNMQVFLSTTNLQHYQSLLRI